MSEQILNPYVEEFPFFKAMLVEKLENTKKEIKELTESLNSTAGGSSDLGESASHDEQQNLATALIQRKKATESACLKALSRIEKKTYGICIQTGSVIPRERLVAIPEARCIIFREISTPE